MSEREPLSGVFDEAHAGTEMLDGFLLEGRRIDPNAFLDLVKDRPDIAFEVYTKLCEERPEAVNALMAGEVIATQFFDLPDESTRQQFLDQLLGVDQGV